MKPMIFAIATCGLLTIGIVAAQQSTPPGARWIAPRAADADRNPFASRPDVVAGGKKVFTERCSVCHREDGTGTKRGPNLTLARVQAESDGALFWKISSGNSRTGMPSFSFLPKPQRWQLVSYLRTLAE